VLQDFLDNKPLFYDTIDYTRMPRIYKRIEEHFRLPKIIHLIGTNAKGTTGRYLATALFRAGMRVGHYTSPHILEFNERIWLNEKNVTQGHLEQIHQELLGLLSHDEAEKLSYFEYTTLLAMLLYSKEADYVVMEAGLGGEHDATAVFTSILTILTPVDFDHQDFLGNTIEAIATTKVKAVKNALLVAKQKHKIVYDVINVLQQERAFKLYHVEDLIQESDIVIAREIAKNEQLPIYIEENMLLAMEAFKLLGFSIQKEFFSDAKLFGRLSKIAPNILLDVGHNALAAEAIVATLKPKKYVLVYNTYRDKEYKKILQILQPIIKRVEIINVESQRVEDEKELKSVLCELGISHTIFKKIKPQEDYLVFGSFSVAEHFLKEYFG
jgi:dihydrofolate synthase/folylpolyglutamate synthase